MEIHFLMSVAYPRQVRGVHSPPADHNKMIANYCMGNNFKSPDLCEILNLMQRVTEGFMALNQSSNK